LNRLAADAGIDAEDFQAESNERSHAHRYPLEQSERDDDSCDQRANDFGHHRASSVLS
jgi:hypothetical protein